MEGIKMYFQKDFQASEIPSKEHISCHSYTSPSGSRYQLHCHPYYEMVYMMEGERFEFLNGTKYHIKQDELFFIPPLAIHGSENLTEVHDIVLQFSPNFLAGLSSSIQSNILLSVTGDKPYLVPLSAEVSKNCIKLSQMCNFTAYKWYDDESRISISLCVEWQKAALFLNLLSKLMDCGQLEARSINTTNASIMQLEPLINQLLSYPEKRIDMTEASRMTGISYFHFSRLFKLTTGFNYAEFCNMLRIRRAEDLLLHSSKSIADISTDIGIDTPSYFTKLFKQINGISPAEYRRRYLE